MRFAELYDLRLYSVYGLELLVYAACIYILCGLKHVLVRFAELYHLADVAPSQRAAAWI